MKPPSSLDYSELLHELTLKRWADSILTENWSRAERAARKLGDSPDPFWRWLGFLRLGMTELYRGLARAALESFGAAVAAAGSHPALVASAKSHMAEVSLEIGDYDAAAEQARQGALSSAPSALPHFRNLFYLAQAEMRRGRPTPARETAEELGRAALAMGIPSALALHHRLSGHWAADRGDFGSARAALDTALSLAPASEKTPAAFGHGRVLVHMGQVAEARSLLQGILDSGIDRIDWPIAYVRALYFLGELEPEPAGERYRKFLDFWQDGDIDRERVERARALVS